MKLFGAFGIYTKTELESRREVEYEQYAKVVNIEARAMLNIAGKQIIPAVIHYNTRLADSVNKVRAACEEADVSVQTGLLKKASHLLAELQESRTRLLALVETSLKIRDAEQRAHAYHDEVMKEMSVLRNAADSLETIMDKDLWPFPSYGDLIFEVSAP